MTRAILPPTLLNPVSVNTPAQAARLHPPCPTALAACPSSGCFFRGVPSAAHPLKCQGAPGSCLLLLSNPLHSSTPGWTFSLGWPLLIPLSSVSSSGPACGAHLISQPRAPPLPPSDLLSTLSCPGTYNYQLKSQLLSLEGWNFESHLWLPWQGQA